MPNYRRVYVPGGTYFFTVALLNRRSCLLTEHIEGLRTAFRAVKPTYPFDIVAMVVLPEHLHCIWTLPSGDADYSTRWRLIKSRFSAGITPGERLSKRRIAKHERGIWQRRFWEHTIQSQQDFNNHFDYIHYNPVKHGWVAQAADWPYSSFHRYVKTGLYPSNWAASLDISVIELE